MADDKREVIRIAVTGHRFLDTNHDLTASIQKVLAQIIQDHPDAESSSSFSTVRGERSVCCQDCSAV